MDDVFDPDSDHGRVYRALMATPRATIEAIAVRTSLTEPTVEKALSELRQADIAVLLDEANNLWEGRRPDLVASAILRRHEDWRIHVRRAEEDLMKAFRYARRQSVGLKDVEVLDTPEEFFRRFKPIQEAARTQVRAIDRPPYYWDSEEILRQETLQCEQMARGITYRTIYQESESDSPIRNASMMRTVAQGEQARVLTDPPVKVTIVDDDLALMALDPPAGIEGTLVTVLIYKSAMFNAIENIFESLWKLAVPINLSRLNQELSEREREILTMMASGSTDEAIARRLGLSRRTVVRDVAKLLEQLGATTRFQAGAQAARRGWL